ncbi:MAG TPA: efflux RND transporter periplasmic adaptor subunit [Candidatus Babeliales bacterium]|nr:efflux RND transporter periplasmic adaptor subunit [Candidatus Babeliales bacterium]
MDSGRKRFFFVIGGLILLAGVVLIVHARRASLPVPTMTIGYVPFAIELPESGVAQYPQIQTISSQVAGNLGRIYVKAGDRVVRGALLATIENPQVVATVASSAAAFASATAKAQSAQAAGGSNLAQAQANLETARTRLAQAQQDLANGLQSGLGYGETTAAEQRAQAEANFASATTNLREARRVYFAYRDLYSEKAVSRDQLDQAEAKYEQAEGTYNQAQLAHASLDTQLHRSRTVLEDNLRSAQEGLVQARAQLDAARVDSGGGEVAAAAAEASRAQAEYALAREQADAMQIRAPYGATVLSVAAEKSDPMRPLQPGDAIEIEQPLLTLAAARGFVVRTRVDEQDVINVRVGERARVTGEDFPGQTLTGRVVEIAPMAQKNGDGPSASRTVATTIAIDHPPPFLRDGMTVNVAILTMDLPRAIAVPADSIVREPNGTYVFVVSNGTAHKRPVRVGAENEGSSLIVSGLRPGDIIVAQNVAGLADGDAVAPAAPSTRS